MSRLEPPALLAVPLRLAFGSAAETRSANIWAKRSTNASNGIGPQPLSGRGSRAPLFRQQARYRRSSSDLCGRIRSLTDFETGQGDRAAGERRRATVGVPAGGRGGRPDRRCPPQSLRSEASDRSRGSSRWGETCRWPKLDPASPRPKDGSTARTAGLSRNAGVAERFSTVSADRRILGVT